MSGRPTISYWHLWTDADGMSRLAQCAMTEFELKSMNAPAEPQWQGKSVTGKMTTMVTAQPVGWIGTWHENPKPQWIVPLSGRWFVEAMDGTRAEMGPGEISLAVIKTAVRSMANVDIGLARSETFQRYSW